MTLLGIAANKALGNAAKTTFGIATALLDGTAGASGVHATATNSNVWSTKFLSKSGHSIIYLLGLRGENLF